MASTNLAIGYHRHLHCRLVAQRKPQALKLGRRWHHHGLSPTGIFKFSRPSDRVQRYINVNATDLEEVGGKSLRELEEVLQVGADSTALGL